MILGRSLRHNAQLFPDRTATVGAEGDILTHSAFADRVWRLADGLRHCGIGKDSRVGILARNSPDYLVAHFALGSMGAWTVPINFALKLPDIDFRMRHAEVDALFVSSEFAPMIADLGAEVVQSLDGRIFALDGEPAGCRPIAELIESGNAIAPDVLVSPEDTLYIGYTSGTTGTPKGALVSHRAIVVGFLYKALTYGLTDRDITINAGPYWHSAPRDFAALALYLGGTAIVPDKFDAELYLADVERYRATNSFLVPTMLQRLVVSPDLKRRDTSSMRALISGGAPLPSTVKERVLDAFGPVLTEFYGATETRIVTVISAAELAARERSVGRPLRDVEIRVLDEDGSDVPCGQMGEIFVRGPGLFSGYWRDPQRTAAAHRGEWFSLGDMGRVDTEGYLYLVDRKQDMIISGGENIFPNDIEECLQRHESVSEAAVIGVPDEQWGEIVVAYVVPAAGKNIVPEELINFCNEQLPNYMKPRRIEIRASLPRNPTGKLLRRGLREQHAKTVVATTG